MMMMNASKCPFLPYKTCADRWYCDTADAEASGMSFCCRWSGGTASGTAGQIVTTCSAPKNSSSAPKTLPKCHTGAASGGGVLLNLEYAGSREPISDSSRLSRISSHNYFFKMFVWFLARFCGLFMFLLKCLASLYTWTRWSSCKHRGPHGRNDE